MLFYADRRRHYEKEHTDIKATDINATLGAEWRALSDTQKAVSCFDLIKEIRICFSLPGLQRSVDKRTNRI